ncbi:YraN family protein [Rhodococcus sp. 06-470-2]|uniref:YraN family protein n=1 Tax=unclassified Rhodococcus (in: high G+C Gram-positive bacteria) TaxID=192944 RepID=UPI000B9C3126|nr:MULTISPECIES: YraN family protein [unclassified Rhodococcus (in: high G+C Gram-positive bacteria)]OZC61326.1 YraN family protein [Rhodococcus sp. 06-470-2]OZE55894.1 YraN family protein [Rhodococcus sp. 05-2221-1B]
MATNQELGARGEELAVRYLEDIGLDVVERNWRHRTGELDIIAREGETVVFVEVKTRSGIGYGTPAEAVTYAKRTRIRGLALRWLSLQQGPWVQIRFDVIAIVVGPHDQPVVTHVRSAF